MSAPDYVRPFSQEATLSGCLGIVQELKANVCKSMQPESAFTLNAAWIAAKLAHLECFLSHLIEKQGRVLAKPPTGVPEAFMNAFQFSPGFAEQSVERDKEHWTELREKAKDAADPESLKIRHYAECEVCGQSVLTTAGIDLEPRYTHHENPNTRRVCGNSSEMVANPIHRKTFCPQCGTLTELKQHESETRFRFVTHNNVKLNQYCPFSGEFLPDIEQIKARHGL